MAEFNLDKARQEFQDQTFVRRGARGAAEAQRLRERGALNAAKLTAWMKTADFLEQRRLLGVMGRPVDIGSFDNEGEGITAILNHDGFLLLIGLSPTPLLVIDRDHVAMVALAFTRKHEAVHDYRGGIVGFIHDEVNASFEDHVAYG